MARSRAPSRLERRDAASRRPAPGEAARCRPARRKEGLLLAALRPRVQRERGPEGKTLAVAQRIPQCVRRVRIQQIGAATTRVPSVNSRIPTPQLRRAERRWRVYRDSGPARGCVRLSSRVPRSNPWKGSRVTTRAWRVRTGRTKWAEPDATETAARASRSSAPVTTTATAVPMQQAVQVHGPAARVSGKSLRLGGVLPRGCSIRRCVVGRCGAGSRSSARSARSSVDVGLACAAPQPQSGAVQISERSVESAEPQEATGGRRLQEWIAHGESAGRTRGTGALGVERWTIAQACPGGQIHSTAPAGAGSATPLEWSQQPCRPNCAEQAGAVPRSSRPRWIVRRASPRGCWQS